MCYSSEGNAMRPGPATAGPEPAAREESRGLPAARPSSTTRERTDILFRGLSSNPLAAFQKHLPGKAAASIEAARDQAAQRAERMQRKQARPDVEATSRPLPTGIGEAAASVVAIVPRPAVPRGLASTPAPGGALLPSLLQSAMLGGPVPVPGAPGQRGVRQYAGALAPVLPSTSGVAVARPPLGMLVPRPLGPQRVIGMTLLPLSAAIMPPPPAVPATCLAAPMPRPFPDIPMPPGILTMAEIVSGNSRGKVNRGPQPNGGRGRRFVPGPDTHRAAQLALNSMTAAATEYQRSMAAELALQERYTPGHAVELLHTTIPTAPYERSARRIVADEAHARMQAAELVAESSGAEAPGPGPGNGMQLATVQDTGIDQLAFELALHPTLPPSVLEASQRDPALSEDNISRVMRELMSSRRDRAGTHAQ